MARTGTSVSLIASIWLASSAMLLAQSGGSSTGGTSSSSSAGTGGTGSSDTGGTAATGTGRVGPGGVPLAPGASGSTIPSQRTEPGGAPTTFGRGEDLSVPPGETRGSGRPTTARTDCLPTVSARADDGRLGPPARIMADEPGRAGQSRGADARATGGSGSAAATDQSAATMRARPSRC
jgi:hypothetical protein